MNKIMLLGMVLLGSSAGASTLGITFGQAINLDNGIAGLYTPEYGFLGGLDLELNPTPQSGVTLGLGMGAANVGFRYYPDSERQGWLLGGRVSTVWIGLPGDRGNIALTGLGGYRVPLGEHFALDLEGALSLALFQYVECNNTLFGGCSGQPEVVRAGSTLYPSVKLRLAWRF